MAMLQGALVTITNDVRDICLPFPLPLLLQIHLTLLLHGWPLLHAAGYCHDVYSDDDPTSDDGRDCGPALPAS